MVRLSQKVQLSDQTHITNLARDVIPFLNASLIMSWNANVQKFHYQEVTSLISARSIVYACAASVY